MIAYAHAVRDCCPGYLGQSVQSDGHVGGQHDFSENALFKETVTWPCDDHVTIMWSPQDALSQDELDMMVAAQGENGTRKENGTRSEKEKLNGNVAAVSASQQKADEPKAANGGR